MGLRPPHSTTVWWTLVQSLRSSSSYHPERAPGVKAIRPQLGLRWREAGQLSSQLARQAPHSWLLGGGPERQIPFLGISGVS